MKSAIIHDWLTSSIGGSENCLQAIHEIFPSPIFSLIANQENLKGSYFENLEIITSFIEKLPFSQKKYRSYLPLFPLAIEQFDLRSFDLVISSSHCVAKGVLTHPHQTHICYCHTPMRYAWDLMHEYLQDANLNHGLKGFLTKCILHYLRGWDVLSSSRVDHFIANSCFVKKRIEKFYGKTADVIYPPVDIENYSLHEVKEDYYLTAGRFVPYKKIDLIVEAFSEMPDKKLIVIGDGPEKEKIQKKSKKNIEFLGYQTNEKMNYYLQRAKGFVFSALEDFGILPVEAMATGTAVIAFGKGGAKETILENETGLFFEHQTIGSLQKAIQQFEIQSWDPKKCRNQAEKFSKKNFTQQFHNLVINKYHESNHFSGRRRNSTLASF